jgi:hypothetical protein
MMLQFQINAAAKLLKLRQPVPGTIAVSPDELTATFTTEPAAQSFYRLFHSIVSNILDLEVTSFTEHLYQFHTGTQ